MTIYDNLAEIDNQFDVFIFDAYGVIYNGAKFYLNVKEYLRHLRADGKTVVILSNSSQLAESAMKGYAEKGLRQDREYDFFVTSGQVCYEDVLHDKLPFKGNKYFMIGQKKEAFRDTNYYQQVQSPQEADFVFISIPYLTGNEVESMPRFQADYLPAKADANGQVVFWDSLTIDPFLSLIQKCVDMGLPALNANPDFYASEKHLGSDKVTFVVRNGLVAEYYRRCGGKVYEFGKPHCNVYNHVFELLAQNGVKCNPIRTAMIGDTIRTDIKGAVNAGIVPVLCLETGLTAHEIENGARLENLLKKEDLSLENIYFIRRVA